MKVLKAVVLVDSTKDVHDPDDLDDVGVHKASLVVPRDTLTEDRK